MTLKETKNLSANRYELTITISAEELADYLRSAGFTSIQVYADRTFAAPRPGEQRIYIKARKGRIK